MRLFRFGKRKRSVSSANLHCTTLKHVLMDRFPHADIFLSDTVYRLCDTADMEEFLAEDRTDVYKYRKESYDCDDFAYRLMGQLSVPGWADLAFGIVWTDQHALNVFVDEDKEVWFIEPQSDAIFEKAIPKMGSRVIFIAM